MYTAYPIKDTTTVAGTAMVTHLNKMRTRYLAGETKTYEWRRNKLLQFRELVLKYEEDIYTALHKDLHKNREEAWVTEVGLVLAEINYALKHLKSWMRPKRVGTNLVNLPSTSYIYNEPLGVVLIIGPWNFPFLLLFGPLVGALAAGNVVVMKPSEYAPATATLIHKMITKCFDDQELFVVEGDGATVVPEMMVHFAFDHVFFTGGTSVGKIIYELAASKLVPVTLELGGKSPCVVEADANISVAARRITMTTFVNSGQMCVAPDYILVHETVKDKLVKAMKESIVSFFSDSPHASDNYGRIINDRQFNRLIGYLNEGRIIHGGQYNAEAKFIAPTLIDNVSRDSPIMKEEIFGPILPILTFKNQQEALQVIAENPNPLSFSVYTNSKKTEESWINAVSFGGGCVNNSSWQFSNPEMPFGGRGKSGIGAAHGKFSYDTFSHRKSVLKTPTWFDPSLKYPPFKGKLSLFKKIIG
ncbi:aldehyde dehydrogenase [Flavihumibacter profundi]|uniref:aldehyde dehydrogenase n=1 Tax=Flavihumibacter profundi TaxID=2716883 RepID=UPI001CC81394|nr:aldehyde dehydrogenase [Flavihumibacter profundi]MBZ5857886.1 aldehyde dehydrogenase [Flavihumibacter profundi]